MNKKESKKYPQALLTIVCICLLLSSCKVYKQNIILQTDNELNIEVFQQQLNKAYSAYPLQKGDQLKIEVFTNKGERVIDPNLELGGGQGAGGQMRPEKIFTIYQSGLIVLPLIGELFVENETVASFQERLSELYSEFYFEPFVRVTIMNNRVSVLGALGGQVIPLENENTTLLEVLAAAGGLNNKSKGSNIRLIRGPLNNPAVQIIDLSTIDGLKKANLRVLPNDVIYIEPVRRVFNETIRDAAPIVGVITNVVTLLIVIQNLN